MLAKADTAPLTALSDHSTGKLATLLDSKELAVDLKNLCAKNFKTVN